MLKLSHIMLLVVLLLSAVACSNAPTPAVPAASTSVDASGVSQPDELAQESEPPAAPVPTTTPVPTATPAPTATPESLFYNLPSAILTSPTGLYASPNGNEYVTPGEIPGGQTVYVMGRNATNTHLRTVWNTAVGWVPVAFTDYNGAIDRLTPLPVFEHEPPACAQFVTTQFNVNSTWPSASQQRIAVVVDLFRSQYGDFPISSIALTVNGAVVDSSRREIVERGQFPLKDVVLSLPADVQSGDQVGYLLEPPSTEALSFMATIFSVPQGCNWDTN